MGSERRREGLVGKEMESWWENVPGGQADHPRKAPKEEKKL